MVKLQLDYDVCQKCPFFEALVEKTWEDKECVTTVKCDKRGCRYMMDMMCETLNK